MLAAAAIWALPGLLDIESTNASFFAPLILLSMFLVSEALRTRVRVGNGRVHIRRFGFLGASESMPVTTFQGGAFELSAEGLEPQVLLRFGGQVIRLGPWDTGFRTALERKCRAFIKHLEEVSGSGSP